MKEEYTKPKVISIIFDGNNKKIKGDFENGGMQFFGLNGATWQYGNEISFT